MKLGLRIRRHTAHNNICDVWLIYQASGEARASLMHGTITEALANELAESLGVPVEREDFPLASSPHEPEMMPEAKMERQKRELF